MSFFMFHFDFTFVKQFDIKLHLYMKNLIRVSDSFNAVRAKKK